MIGTFAFLNGFCLVLGAYLAFKTRKVTSAFRESSYIAACIYNILVTSVLILPIVFIEEVGYLTAFYMRSIGILLCCGFILAALFGPKLFIILFQKEKNTATYTKTFKMQPEKGKVSSFDTPQAHDGTEIESHSLYGKLLFKEEEALTSLFFGEKWTPRHCYLFKSEACLGWRKEGSAKEGGFLSLSECEVTAYDEKGMLEFEISTLGDTPLHFKCRSEEEFQEWSSAFKVRCKFRAVHVKNPSSSPAASSPAASSAFPFKARNHSHVSLSAH